MTTPSRIGVFARASAALGAVVASAAVSGLLVGRAAGRLSGNRMAPWILGRAAGISTYLLLVALVLFGLTLSHPARDVIRIPSTTVKLRLHIALAAFTLAFLVLHVVALATDRWAGVGWWGAVVPMGASYRPVATTLGVIAAWSGLLAGGTALLAGRLPRRAWWPIHKVAAATLVLAWLHGVLGGGDSTTLLPMYIGTAALIGLVAASRYTARRPADKVAELEAALAVPR